MTTCPNGYIRLVTKAGCNRDVSTVWYTSIKAGERSAAIGTDILPATITRAITAVDCNAAARTAQRPLCESTQGTRHLDIHWNSCESNTREFKEEKEWREQLLKGRGKEVRGFFYKKKNKITPNLSMTLFKTPSNLHST